jgi:hypothetical protein
MKTHEGAQAHIHSLDHNVEFFAKAGSMFTKAQRFYRDEQNDSALKLFVNSWIQDPVVSMKLLLWLRDCRGGSGNRSASREIIKWLSENDADWLRANLPLIPMYGRWDDLRSLFGTPLQDEAAMLWSAAIKANDVLAAKWADRNDWPLRHQFRMKIGDFRRLLAKIRKNHIVEYKMCKKNWNEIDYNKIPSVAMARYTKAFFRNDEDRFKKYKEGLVTGESTIHASVLFPHDCVRTALNGDRQIADAQFKKLPDFLSDAGERILVISDTSGSMYVRVSGSVEAMHISQGLALYCSSRMPEDSPFYKLFIGFESESNFKNWRGMTFSDAVHNHVIFDGAVGSTRIDRALNLILRTAIERSIPEELMPTTLLIVSDMQFHSGSNTSDTEVEHCLKKFDNEGYNRPKVVYWDTAGYSGVQDTVKAKNVALISGFSPSILKSVFAGDDFSPRSVMLSALEKYEIETPY